MQAEPEPATAEQPKHPLSAMTSYELSQRRRELERAIKGIPADAPVQSDLRTWLDDVLAEQEERERIRQANA